MAWFEAFHKGCEKRALRGILKKVWGVGSEFYMGFIRVRISVLMRVLEKVQVLWGFRV